MVKLTRGMENRHRPNYLDLARANNVVELIYSARGHEVVNELTCIRPRRRDLARRHPIHQPFRIEKLT